MHVIRKWVCGKESIQSVIREFLQRVINVGEMGRYVNTLHSLQILILLIITNQPTAHRNYTVYIYNISPTLFGDRQLSSGSKTKPYII
jgi:hypothetical protein